MPADTPDQQITLPVGTDLAAVVTAMQNAIADIETRLNLRYASAADRAVRHPAGIEGECSDLAAENWADSFNGAAWISRTARGHRAIKIRTANQVVNNSIALVNDNTLFAPLEATGTFIWDADIYYDSATAADAKFAFTWPGAPPAVRWGGLGRNIATNTNVEALTTTASGTALAFGSTGVGVVTWLRMSGFIVDPGAAGNLQLQFAQQVADPTDLILRPGSRLKLLKIS